MRTWLMWAIAATTLIGLAATATIVGVLHHARPDAPEAGEVGRHGSRPTLDFPGESPGGPGPTQITSDTYREAGFGKFTFGSSMEEIAALVPGGKLQDSRTPGEKMSRWSTDPGREYSYLFSAGKLVGIGRAHQGDNTGYRERLVDTFGECDAAHIHDLPWRGVTSSGRVETWYYAFPQTFVCVGLEQRLTPTDIGPAMKSDWAGWQMFDRSWALDETARIIRAEESLLVMVRRATERVNRGEELLGQLEEFPACTMKKVLNQKRPGCGTVNYLVDDPEYDNQMAALATLLNSGPPAEGGKTAIGLNFDYVPLGAGIAKTDSKLLATRLKSSLLFQCQSELIQKAFPPKDGTINATADDRPRRIHQWGTADGWRVRVFSDNSASLTREPSNL